MRNGSYNNYEKTLEFTLINHLVVNLYEYQINKQPHKKINS